MGRSPCCDKVGLKKGPWTPEEDEKLKDYIAEHGHGSWRALPAKAGLQRCGKSCRLRWTNYLRPDIKRGKFSLQEENTIMQLHALLGNRWSAIATHLPKRTDNEIKNYWNTHLKKRLMKSGIDPVTHKPKNDALGSVNSQNKNDSNLSHMAQWESARLEAEARLVRESKLRSNSLNHQLGLSASSSSLDLGPHSSKGTSSTSAQPPCLDVLRAWQGGWPKATKCSIISGEGGSSGLDLESPTSTLSSFSENSMPMPIPTVGFNSNHLSSLELLDNLGSYEGVAVKEESEEEFRGFAKMNSGGYKERIDNSVTLTAGLHVPGCNLETPWPSESSKIVNDHVPGTNFIEGFTNLLLANSVEDRNSVDNSADSENADSAVCDEYEENKNYWNNILNLVNSSPSDSPAF